jgi:hypothetical protein
MLVKGYIDKNTKKREGRRIRYRVDPGLPLRHEMQQDKAIGDLLEVLGWKRRENQSKEENQNRGRVS